MDNNYMTSKDNFYIITQVKKQGVNNCGNFQSIHIQNKGVFRCQIAKKDEAKFELNNLV